MGSPELTGLTHLATVGLSTHLGNSEYWNNYSGQRGSRAAYPLGNDHIVVLCGGNWGRTAFDYVLFKISTGEIVDAVYDGSSEHVFLDSFGDDLIGSTIGPDRCVRYAAFPSFTVVADMGQSSWVNLTIMSVANDSLVLNTIEVYDQMEEPIPDLPGIWPFYNTCPPTLIKTGPNSVSFVCGDGSAEYFFVFDIDVTENSAIQQGVRAYPMFPDFPVTPAWPFNVHTDPMEEGHRELVFWSQGLDQTVDGSHVRDWYVTRFHTGTGAASTTKAIDHPALHSYRNSYRLISARDTFYALERGEELNTPSGAVEPEYPGGRLYGFSASSGELTGITDVRPDPEFSDRNFLYGAIAQTQWHGRHPHSLILSKRSGSQEFYLVELLDLDSQPRAGGATKLPPDPTGVSDEITMNDMAVSDVVAGKYLVLAWGGWAYFPDEGWDDHETWIAIYELPSVMVIPPLRLSQRDDGLRAGLKGLPSPRLVQRSSRQLPESPRFGGNSYW